MRSCTERLGDSFGFLSGTGDLALGHADAILENRVYQSLGVGGKRKRGWRRNVRTDFSKFADKYSWMERFLCC